MRAQMPLVYLAPGFKELKRCHLVPLQLVQPLCVSEVQHVLHPKSGPLPQNFLGFTRSRGCHPLAMEHEPRGAGPWA